MKKLGNEIKRIIKINPDKFSVKVEYNDGAVREVPLHHIFGKPKGLAAEVLRGGMFEMCFIESGALAWPNGMELCPDAMRMWSEASQTKATPNRRRA
jgi:hypothetical protein